MLTKKQKEILNFVEKYIRSNDYSPSLKEIGRKFKLSSIATVHQHIENLKQKGYLSKSKNSARSIVIRKKIVTIKSMLKRQDKIIEMFPKKQQKLINEAINIEHKLTMIEQGYSLEKLDR
ncbi:hypothetical protein KKC65_02435 [Patescibacteria group bacterium]|nr:hypothetical protein [Patescibacteria group bacterium]